MGRPSKIWRRKGRPGYWATIDGRQVNLGEDREAAQQELHRLKARSAPPRPDATVAELVDRYLEHVQPRLSPVTHRYYCVHLQDWVDHAGRLRASSLDAEHLTRWLDKHPQWGSSTRHFAISVIKAWANWCLDPSPFRSVKRPRMGRRKPPPPGALEAVIAAFPGREMRDFATVLYETGMRPGEARAIKASGVLRERSVATVEGKTGMRLVGLSGRALAVLTAYAAKYPDGPILRDAAGRPWTNNAINAQFRRCSIRVGMGRVCAYHARHAFWARAHKAGVDSIAIARQLGHSSLAMLGRHYAHEDAEIMRETARRVAGR